jgi:hypothetical protein
LLLAASLALALPMPPARAAPADEKRELEQLRATTMALIEALVSQGLLTRERADAILRQAQARPAAAEPPVVAAAPPVSAVPALPAASAPAAGRVIRVPYVSQALRDELREEIRNDVLATAREERWADPRTLPDWVRGVTVEGDVRLRWETDKFAAPTYAPGYAAGVSDPCLIATGNLPAPCYRGQVASPAWSPDLANTTIDRDRMTLRARLGLTAKVSEDTQLGFRLSTGGTTGPTSSSQTLGTQFNKLNVVIDRAYLRWEPRFDVRLIGGRMANPFFGSDLLWPDDLSFDGLAAQAERNVASGAYVFGTVGAFPLEEFNTGKRDKWLYAAQLGADWTVSDRIQWRAGLALYQFARAEGVRESGLPPTGVLAGTTAYQSSQYPTSLRLKGNTLINLNDPSSNAAPVWGLASKFRPINLTSVLTLTHFSPVEVGLQLDWVHNSAFDINDIRARAGSAAVDGLAARTTGLQGKLTVGAHRLNNAGEWQGFIAWRKFERDAWIDGFTDTTWHLGGTSYKGFQLGGAYAFDRHTTVGLRVSSTRNLDDGVRFLAVPGDPTSLSGNLSSAPLKIDVLQIDLNTRF